MPAWIVIVEWLARLILLGLIGLSVWSVRIMLERKSYFAQNAKSDLESIFDNTNELLSAEAFERTINRNLTVRRSQWESGLPVLGTLGATAPFVGLFGTVLGIIVSFGNLSSGNADSFQVMASLAEALILTAVGLAVAIPAVIANNLFGRKILSLVREVESRKEIGIIERLERGQ